MLELVVNSGDPSRYRKYLSTVLLLGGVFPNIDMSAEQVAVLKLDIKLCRLVSGEGGAKKCFEIINH